MSVKALLLHLRLNWQLILMPIFLWGFFLSGGKVGHKFWLGLFVYHVLFYGGSVAFNSYYDQDEGPIGGLWDPPRPTRALLIFSLLVQGIGFVLVGMFMGPALWFVALGMWILSTAYSHPAIRLKAHPWLGLATVTIGQGIGGALSGWLCGQNGSSTLLTPRTGLGLLVSMLITTGFYPLSQIYQRAEDQLRGDITFAVRLGERCFPFAMACFAAAGILAATLMGYYYSNYTEAALILAALLTLAGLVYDWWQRFDASQVRQNYVRLMRIGYVMGIGFIAFVGWHLIERG